MTISYKWISEYIPLENEPEKISHILTSIGLEVESMEHYESIRGGLEGLVVGEVKECRPHPAADKLKLTKVDTGNGELLKIVCGAPNVAVGQKVIIAKIGTTIYPAKGDPLTMKIAKIRGEESYGMICAEDEISLGENHDGILVLPNHVAVGTAVSDYFKPYTDWIYEIGLTPNRMDAMSHFGVARDICAYLSHHENSKVAVKMPAVANFTASGNEGFKVEIENSDDCRRYAGVTISGIKVKPSPQWLQDKLKAIGQRPINNIVDITNYILHDTGQPLHAFDAEKVAGNKIIVKNLPEGSSFLTLDGKERKLGAEDLMICDGNSRGLCIAGVYGGAVSGVTAATKDIFLESAWFNPTTIRKTSFRHGLRTDAATRFEKSVDISNTTSVLKRAASLIKELAGGEITSGIIDVYPVQRKKEEVELSYNFLEKLSGKEYDREAVHKILSALGFEIVKAEKESLLVAVPYSKPDVTLPADVVEEIMRIDGYDNILIPSSITISPARGANDPESGRKEKVADYLAGAGFNEIFTNSITNAAYFDIPGQDSGVKLLNNLSAVHNIMRPSMLETGLESIAYNLNRKNPDLRFFEFGKTYHKLAVGKYDEPEHLCLYVTGNKSGASWKGKAVAADIYYLKGVVEMLLTFCGLHNVEWTAASSEKMGNMEQLKLDNEVVAEVGIVSRQELSRFDIRTEVFYADLKWNILSPKAAAKTIKYKPVPQQLPVYRDLAMVLPASVPFGEVEAAIKKSKPGKLRLIELFDVFVSEKLGAGKKSFAITLTFLDEEKTLTDKEIDGMMTKIMRTLEQDLDAEIRKGAEKTTA